MSQDQPNQSQIEQLQLHLPSSQINSLLGQPLAQTQKPDGITSFRYTSDNPTYTNYLYFQNDSLEMISINKSSQSETLDKYINLYGLPETSIQVYPDVGDSLLNTLHIWANQGLAVFTQGNLPTSSVTRIHKFSPSSLERYFQTWGKNYSSHSTMPLQTPPVVHTATPSAITRTPPSRSLLPLLPSLFSVAIVVIISVTVIIFYLRRRRSSRPSHPTPLPESPS